MTLSLTSANTVYSLALGSVEKISQFNCKTLLGGSSMTTLQVITFSTPVQVSVVCCDKAL